MIGYINQQGQYIEQHSIQTTKANLINQVSAIPAEHKYLSLEQGNKAFWAAELLRDHVERLIMCDPHYNKLISRSSNKNDPWDTLHLCKLLRLGELKQIWSPKQMGLRRLFYGQVKQYHRLVKTLTIHKHQLQANLRHWGINRALTKANYPNPDTILDQMSSEALGEEVSSKFSFIQQIEDHKNQQLGRMKQTGSKFWEISEFQKMSGIGPIGAHSFSGYIQTPHRFRKRGQLIRFCQLGIRKRTSDGRRLASERLDKAGHGLLKNIAHVAWKTSQATANEVNGFYQASLDRYGDPLKPA